MKSDPHLETFLDLCQTVLARLKRDRAWPCPDSQFSVDLVESNSNDKDA